MEQFIAVPKKWGNSMGITIPKEVVKHEDIKPRKEITVLVMSDANKKLKKVFGSLQLSKDTQKVMDEIDKGYDEH